MELSLRTMMKGSGYMICTRLGVGSRVVFVGNRMMIDIRMQVDGVGPDFSVSLAEDLTVSSRASEY